MRYFQSNRFRVLNIAYLFGFWMLATGTGHADQLRQWTYQRPTDKKAVTFEAEFIGLKGVSVTVRAEDGKLYELPLMHFGANDIRYAEKMGQTDQGSLTDWTDALGNELKVRYAGIANQAVTLFTQQGGSFQVPWERLDSKQKAYVVKAQELAVAANMQQARAARGWQNMDGGIQVATLNAEESQDKRTTFLSFSPDNKLLLSTHDGEVNTIWGIRDLRRHCQLELPRHYDWACASHLAHRNRFDPLARQVLWCGDYDIYRWGSTSGRALTQEGQHRSAGHRVAQVAGLNPKDARFSGLTFCQQGKLAAVSFWSDVFLLDSAFTKVLEVLKVSERSSMESSVSRLAFSRNGRILVGCYDHWAGSRGLEAAEHFHVWNLATKDDRVIRARGYFGSLVDDGELLAICYDWKTTVFETATGKVAHTYQAPERGTRRGGIAVSPVGRCVALVYENMVYLDAWDTGTNIAVLDRHQSPITYVDFSPDGGMLATGDAQGNINLWNVASITSVGSSKQ